MKSSNLAWRIEPFEESLEARPVESAGPPAWSALETPDAKRVHTFGCVQDSSSARSRSATRASPPSASAS